VDEERKRTFVEGEKKTIQDNVKEGGWRGCEKAREYECQTIDWTFNEREEHETDTSGCSWDVVERWCGEGRVVKKSGGLGTEQEEEVLKEICLLNSTRTSRERTKELGSTVEFTVAPQPPRSLGSPARPAWPPGSSHGEQPGTPTSG
jgi:hypothetical protein